MIKDFKIGKYRFVHTNPKTNKPEDEEQQRYIVKMRGRFQVEALTEENNIDVQGDQTGFSFSVFDGRKMVGAFVFYGVKRVRGGVSVFPMPSFPELSPKEEIRLLGKCADYFFTTDLETDNGKKFKIQEIKFYYQERTEKRVGDAMADASIKLFLLGKDYKVAKVPVANGKFLIKLRRNGFR